MKEPNLKIRVIETKDKDGSWLYVDGKLIHYQSINIIKKEVNTLLNSAVPKIELIIEKEV